MRIRLKYVVNPNLYYQIGDGDHGSIQPSDYTDNGIPYYRVQNLTWDGSISESGLVFISNEVHLKNAKSIIRPGDILLAKTGATIGKIAIVGNNYPEGNTTSSVAKITVDTTRYITKYVAYCLMTHNFHDQMWLDASQKSAQPGFNIEDLINYEIEDASIEAQK